MSRTNEFKIKSEAFGGIEAAISALDSLLNDVSKSREACSNLTESERRYRKNASGLKDSIDAAIAACADQWIPYDLDSSFFLREERLENEIFTYVVSFIHPVYEHLWLTTPEGENVCESLMPFLSLTLEYSKYSAEVKLTTMQLETTFHLPNLRASIRSSQEDLEIIKQEAERINNCITAAIDTQEKMVEAVQGFCGEVGLKIDKKGDVPMRPEPRRSSPPHTAARTSVTPKNSMTPEPEPKPESESVSEPESDPETQEASGDQESKGDDVVDLDDELEGMSEQVSENAELPPDDTLPGVELDYEKKSSDNDSSSTRHSRTGRFSTLTPPHKKKTTSTTTSGRFSTLNPRRK